MPFRFGNTNIEIKIRKTTENCCFSIKITRYTDNAAEKHPATGPAAGQRREAGHGETRQDTGAAGGLVPGACRERAGSGWRRHATGGTQREARSGRRRCGSGKGAPEPGKGARTRGPETNTDTRESRSAAEERPREARGAAEDSRAGDSPNACPAREAAATTGRTPRPSEKSSGKDPSRHEKQRQRPAAPAATRPPAYCAASASTNL